jgi:hypothetical protein
MLMMDDLSGEWLRSVSRRSSNAVVSFRISKQLSTFRRLSNFSRLTYFLLRQLLCILNYNLKASACFIAACNKCLHMRVRPINRMTVFSQRMHACSSYVLCLGHLWTLCCIRSSAGCVERFDSSTVCSNTYKPSTALSNTKKTLR